MVDDTIGFGMCESAYEAFAVIAEEWGRPDICDLTFTSDTIQDFRDSVEGWHGYKSVVIGCSKGHQTLMFEDIQVKKGDTRSMMAIVDLGAYRACWKV